MRSESDEVALPDLLEVLRRRIWVILACFLICLCVGIFLSLAPRKYVADSLLRVQLGAASQYRSSPAAQASAVSADEFSPYVDILSSRTLYLRVAQDLDLANNVAFLSHPIAGHQSLNDPSVRNDVLRVMNGRITISHKPKDEIIRVNCSTTVPILSARIVDTLVNDFVDELVESHYGASKRSSNWLVGQLDDLKRQVESDQVKLTSLQAKLGIVGLSDKEPDYLVAQSLGSLSKAASTATVDRILAEAKYRFLSESDPSLIEGEISLLGSGTGAQAGNLLQTLRNAQAVQSSEYARSLTEFGPNFPETLQKRAQLDETTRQVTSEQARILNQAKLSYSAAADNERLTQQELNTTQGKAFDLRNEMVQYVILQHDYESHRNLYESLISRLQEAGITAGLGGGEVDILDLATVPTLPAPPGRLTYLGGAAAAGLALGCILALLLEAFNSRIITPDQARRASSLNLLAALPQLKSGLEQLASEQDSIYLEAVESLRSSLLNEPVPPKVILLTSTVSGEGKSLTSAALSIVISQHAMKTLLIDCDLRSNTMASHFHLTGVQGLSSVLTGQVPLDEVTQIAPAFPNLTILVSGEAAKQRPTILLGSAQFRDLIESARQQYSHVILNCPPVLGLSDVLDIGQLADTIVLVVRSSMTRRQDLELAEQALENANLIVSGYILNGVRSGREAYVYRPNQPSSKQKTRGVQA